MTVGDGILWSTIIFVAFVSVVLLTKYRRWKTFLKVVVVTLLFVAVLGGSSSLYSWYAERPRIITSLNGISLGMSELEVTLAKGKPDKVSELSPKAGGLLKLLTYNTGYKTYTTVALKGAQDSMTVADICGAGSYEEVFGLSKFSSEEDILKKLGSPSNISINQEGTRKTLNYPQWNVSFEVEKGEVDELCVTSGPGMHYSKEYRQPKLKE